MGRHNISRSSSSMRGLPKGRTTYSFPDHIWKVKKPKGKGWKTRRKGSPAQIGKKFKAKTKAKPIKTKATSFRIKPPQARKPMKPKKIVAKKKLKVPKIPKKPRVRTKMTHIEKMHLLAQCKQFNVDPQEIDNTITYYENKKHVQEMARIKGYSEAEISSVETEQRETVSQYQQYLNNLKGELEEAGYVISGPNL